jgi:hypothetical protein
VTKKQASINPFALFLFIVTIANTSLGWIVFSLYQFNNNHFHLSSTETEGWYAIVCLSGIVSLIFSPIWSITWLNFVNISTEDKMTLYWLNAFPSILFQSIIRVTSLSPTFTGMLNFSSSWIVIFLSSLPPLVFFMMNWLCYRKVSKKYRMMSLVFLSIAFYPCGYAVQAILWHTK